MRSRAILAQSTWTLQHDGVPGKLRYGHCYQHVAVVDAYRVGILAPLAAARLSQTRILI